MKKSISKKNKIKIKDLISKLQFNSFFYILLIATFITSIPSPALGFGSSTIPGGLICILLSIQLMLGFKKIYLPEFLLNIKIKKSIIKKLTTFISQKQITSNNDNKFFNSIILNKISGLMIFFNGVLMCIPIIFTNWHPSISTSIISLAHIIKNKNLLLLFYCLSIFMFIGYTLFFYLIFKVIKHYSKNYSLSDIMKNKKYLGLFYLLGFFVICASIFLFIIIFGAVGYFSKNVYVNLFMGK